MTIAEWFYVDENFELKLTDLGKQNKEAVKSYNEYLREFEKELSEIKKEYAEKD